MRGVIMRRYSYFFTALFLILLCHFASGQSLQLIYLDGEAYVQKPEGWVLLFDGESIAEDSRIKLSPSSVAEFSGPEASLLFSKPGIYKLRDALRAQDSREDHRMLSSIFHRISRMGGGSEQGKSHVMGLRGSKAMQENELSWMEEENSGMEEAITAYKNEEYQQAIKLLEEEVDPFLLSDTGEYWYYLAASHMAMGNRGPALHISRTHSIEPFSPFYSKFLLLKGRLHLASSEFEIAAESLKEYIKSAPSPAHAQLGHYLYASASIKLGAISEARRALEAAVALDRDRELTLLASSVLSGL